MQAGISLRTVYEWLRRYRSGRAAALVVVRSVSGSQRRRLDPHDLQRAVALRRIARLLALQLSNIPQLYSHWPGAPAKHTSSGAGSGIPMGAA